MALDVYVGPLTRYYMGDWESVGGNAPREPTPRPRIGRAQDSEQVHESVLIWRRALVESLSGTVAMALEWDESADTHYFSGRPGWDGFGSLVLWAAYAEHPGLRPPASLPEEWDDDVALGRSNAQGFRSRYSHLVRNVELWLPVPFEFTFEGEDVNGRRIVMGSASTLGQQLADLNAATWKARADNLIASTRRAPPLDAPLDVSARYAFAVLSDLTAKAVEHGLPMKLDF